MHWDGKIYHVRFNYSMWSPEVHCWFVQHKPVYRWIPLSGSRDCSYAFKEEADAIAFKLRFADLCRSWDA
jgi:hypothetical protein